MLNCKISVCIPTYNYAGYLAETIESVLQQHFADFELIIIDDNSTDDTRAVVERYAEKDPRIRFSVNPKNLGMVQNWNLCLERARGEYIKFVFGDDLLSSPDTLGRMAALLDGDSSVSLACSARNFIDERSRVLKVESHFATGSHVGTEVICTCLAKKENLVGEPSVVMFRKAQATRGFRVNYRQIVDLEMWFHLLEQGSLAYIDEPLCSFRVHDEQQTAKNRENLADIYDYFYLIDDYLCKDYIVMPAFMKQFVRFDNSYAIWKQYKRKKLTRKVALEIIGIQRSYASFRFWYPFYKMYKPCLKAYRRMTL